MKNKQIIKIGNFVLVPTNDSTSYIFSDAIDKALFVNQNDKRTYELMPNRARVYLYIVIDTEGTGWCLTPKCGVTYTDALNLINHYL